MTGRIKEERHTLHVVCTQEDERIEQKERPKDSVAGTLEGSRKLKERRVKKVRYANGIVSLNLPDN